MTIYVISKQNKVCAVFTNKSIYIILIYSRRRRRIAMKWNPKKFMAFVLTIGMVISPVRTAFAEGELEEGNG